ncbi:MAG: signal peptidase I [Lachnospiraceae bacterium]|nr:signal peptidase I [Lachnospiraceae bacterium]
MKRKNSSLKSVVNISVFILIVLVAAYLIFYFVTQRTRVRGSSMETTLYDGDNIMIDKLSYHLRDIKRNEVICFTAPRAKETLIKRVVGLPGESVRISGGAIYIDGEIIEDRIGGISFAGRAESEILLGSDEYFVLGDNRDESIDSRYEEIGNVNRRNIIGRAFFLFYPFDRMRVVK